MGVLRGGDALVQDLYRRRRYPLEGGEVTPGSVVQVEIRRDQDENERALVLAELAVAGSVEASLYQILAHFGVSPLYPAEVQAEAEAWLSRPGLDDGALQDLTSSPFITIDNVGSRDLDQALHIARGDGGGHLVSYALADASYYVRPGSALFHEALHRGATYYLPRLAAPMLPRALSEGLISLNPGVRRRALVLEMHLDQEGHLVETRVLRALIRSRAQLTYEGVQRFHDDPASSLLAGHDYTETLELLREVGEHRIADARARDVVSFDRSEVDYDIDGERLIARGRQRNNVERWNEQISLLCNMEGARLLAEGGEVPHVQAVYRVHPLPSPEGLRALHAAIEAIILAHGLDRERWRWRARVVEGEAGESLSEYVDRLPDEPGRRRICQVIERLAMHASQAASFSNEQGPHWGVGAEGYSRISSPMREIVGVFTHKELLERLGDPAEACDNDADEALRVKVVEAANRSKSVQREITKRIDRLAIDQLLEGDLARAQEERPWHVGTVVGVRPTRMYVELDEPPIELKLYLRALVRPALDLALDPEGVSLSDRKTGRRFTMGDEVRLRVRGHDRSSGRWSFEIGPSSGLTPSPTSHPAPLRRSGEG